MKKIIFIILICLGSYYFFNSDENEYLDEVVNSQPVSVSQNIFLNKNGSINIFLEYEDSDNDNVIFEIVDYPNYGELKGNNRNWTYKSYADYSGKDFFTYRVHDGSVYSEKAKISIKILNNNIELMKKLKNENLVDEKDKKRKYQLNKKRSRLGTPRKIERGIKEQIAYKEPLPRDDGFTEIEEQKSVEEIADQIESEENDIYVNQQIESYLNEFQFSDNEFKTKFNSLKNKIMNRMLRERNSRTEASLEDYRLRIINETILEEGKNNLIEEERNTSKEEDYIDDDYNRDERVDEYKEENYRENEGYNFNEDYYSN